MSSAATDAAEQLAGKLTAAGIPATIDPAALPPMVLVDLVYPDAAAGVGGWRCRLAVKIVAAPPLDLTGRRWLEGTWVDVLRVLGFASGAPLQYDAGAKTCPGVTLTYPLEIANPDC